MFRALSLHVIAIPVVALQLLRALPAEGWRHAWKRAPLFLLAWIGFTLLNLLHLAGHLLDEILFPGYRKTPIREPVFVLGIPRSGTTYLQRLLVRHPGLTTFTLWEALLAPSISERYLYRILGLLLRPLQTGINAVRRRLFHHMDKIHQLGLLQPEEDFLLWLPVLGCLLPAFACPRAGHYWRLGFFDRDLPAGYRNLLLGFYHRCLQKHLFYHGARHGDLRLLSKNPSFTPLAGSLLAHFPDARLVACTRTPAEVVPSQLSALRPAMRVLGDGKLSPYSQDKMLMLLQHYYSTLRQHLPNARVRMVPMPALKAGLDNTMASLLDFLRLPADPAFVESIAARAAAPAYASAHRYDLNQFALTEAAIDARFQGLWPLPENPGEGP